ncbi:type I restriction enzyme HsdR N-terminal domain-containing protein [Aeromonas hydrophila]|uniref:type I restriction enzyme HsdR N-terminal domain-containing protein n=1 Tax=Aeromonas hydrophila TaxID=644 RepID=UPI00227B8731|nr:type I restriction enzyme HsdR N-terminal domain-containing protein [Aeromonas hydrophila]WAG13851.1 type I restriction enzyme HsdR N-terminal domain-containing protein [Aeromonas hydrophila]
MNEVEVMYLMLFPKLKELGYPESSIRQEFVVQIDRNQRKHIDIAILDPDSNDVIAIIEVKSGSKPRALENAAQQVASYARVFPSAPLPLVYISDGKQTIIGVVDEDDASVKLLPELPEFSSLLKGDRAQQKLNTKTKTTRTTDRFTFSCYFMALLVSVILIFDVIGFYKFSSQQLSLLFLFIGLLVIPYAAKFKLLGMEFERNSDGKAKNN